MFPVRGLNITSKPIQPALHILCSLTFFKVSFPERVLHASSVVCLNSLRMKSECETTETELCDEFFNSSQNSFVRSLTKEEDVSLSSPAVHHLSLTSRESTSKYYAHLHSLKMSTIVCVSARLSKFSFSDALLNILVPPHSMPTESRPPTDLISRHALDNRKSTLGHIWASSSSLSRLD